MSTVTIEPSAIDATAPAGAVLCRFVWKEFRVLSGLWLAVAVLGMLVQLAVNFFTPPGLDHATPLFISALAAGVLYAVGAAATMFSVEHEDETYAYLSGLPTTWWPMFVGKLIVATSSAVALAAALSLSGWVIGGLNAPVGRDAGTALGLFGIGIIEAIAWGTLFSLLTKRPVVAALLTLIVGVTVTQLAASALASGNAGAGDPASYAAAIPLRLAIVALVFAAATLVARRWLIIGTWTPRRAVAGAALRTTFGSQLAQRVHRIGVRADSGTRRRMLARLLWQTWRDSWKLLPLPIGVALVLSVTASLLGFLTGRGEVGAIAVGLTVFFAPAVYGALAFAADQRRSSYRFLAEHAAWPRYVWFARHTVWLGTIAIAVTFFSVIVAALIFARLDYVLNRLVDQYMSSVDHGYPSAQDVVFDMYRTFTGAIHGAGLAGCGILAAYGIGQFWSMLLRSEITSAFVSIVLSAALAAWVAILIVWQLPGWLFLLPLFAGLMLATWLRAPDWITDRRTWRAWSLPVLAITAALLLIGLLLPIVRLAQLPASLGNGERTRVVADTAIANQLDWYRHGDSPEARETAAIYERAAEMLHSWQDNDLLDRWSKPEYMAPIGGNGLIADEILGIDVSKIPANERPAFREAVEKWTQLERKATQAAIRLATEASLRPSRRFDFDIGQAQPVRNDPRRHLDLYSIPSFRRMNELLDVVIFSASNPNEAPGNLFVALRMCNHLRSGQPSVVDMEGLRREQQVLEQFGQWAFHADRTEEQLRQMAEQLHEFFRASSLSPDENLIADHLLIQDVLDGGIFPLALAEGSNHRTRYLAYLANQLNWERNRGLRALSLITLQNMEDANELTRHLTNQQVRDSGNWQVRRWLRPKWYGEGWPPDWVLQQPAAATSYLTRFEYEARVRIYDLFREICNTEVCRRAALLEIALAKYRRDHDEFPASLAQLVPAYLEREPIDPYNGQPFQYESGGLDLPLVSSHAPDFETVDPGTPLFWSVGAGNAQLQKQTATRRIEGNLNAQGEPLEVTDTNYVLMSTEHPWWNEPVFVFPLPK